METEQSCDCGQMQNAVRQTLKDDSFSPLYICRTALISHINLRVGCREKLRTRFGKFQSHADRLRLRNTPLLSLARRSCKELEVVERETQAVSATTFNEFLPLLFSCCSSTFYAWSYNKACAKTKN